MTVTVENAPSQEPEELWMWIVGGVVIVFVVTLLLALHILTRRKKRKEMESDESPEAGFGKRDSSSNPTEASGGIGGSVSKQDEESMIYVALHYQERQKSSSMS